jgi:hypothetical protein
MEKICTFIEEKSHYLMTFFIALQGIIFLSICIIMFSNDLIDIKFDIYATLILFLFYGYMVHFAYHSFQKAYYLELIAFLLMSTASSIMSVVTLFYFTFNDTVVVMLKLKRERELLNTWNHLSNYPYNCKLGLLCNSLFFV